MELSSLLGIVALILRSAKREALVSLKALLSQGFPYCFQRYSKPSLMGGHAFASGPDALPTPRMAPEIYFQVRDGILERMRELFAQVAVPIEGPAKTSYGDIDILVAEPFKDESVTVDVLKLKLGACRVAILLNSPTSSFAVLYEGAYIQVDIHVCPLDTFEWQVFHQSHGDLWNLLGNMIRPLGLTANPQGLHVRIEDIEAFDRVSDTEVIMVSNARPGAPPCSLSNRVCSY